MLGESALRSRAGQCSVPRAAEGDEERVALGIDLLPAVLVECRAEDPAVLGQHLAVPVTELLEQAGRALDVREEGGDGPAPGVGPPRASLPPPRRGGREGRALSSS